MAAKFPSVEKPQYRLYRDIPVRDINPEQSIYDLVFKTNKDNMSWDAVTYLKKTWTFQELKTLTDQLADAFVAAGYKAGETVLIGLPACIEALLCLLAINKIGGISRWIDMRAGREDIVEYIQKYSCRFFVAFDELRPVAESIGDSGVKTIVLVKPVEMQPTWMKMAYGVKEMLHDSFPHRIGDATVVSFSHFLSSGNPANDIPQLPFDKNRPSVVIQSSGTTGKPKSIVHSDFSATSCARSLSYSDMAVGPKKTVLVLLPPWIAYSLGQAILYPLANGAHLLLEPSLNHDSLVKHLGHYDICFGIPLHYRYLYEYFEKLSDEDKEKVYSLDMLVSGGDKMSPDENKEYDHTFRTPVVNGYGNNECWGCLTVNSTMHNRYGSVGIPKWGETLISYDNDTGAELPFNEVGEICARADTAFLYYDGDMDGTLSAKKLHSDGQYWLHTGDLGIIDEDGYVFLKGRIRRVIVRAGFKISAYTIEDTITSLAMVKECVAVQVKDPVDESVPMAFVVLNSLDAGNEAVIRNIILEKCKSELKGPAIPKYILFKDELPYTSNKKYDFAKLEILGNEYVDSLG